METQQTIKDNELIPKSGNPQVGLKVFQILDEILKYRNEQGLTELWNQYYKLRRNKHWKNKKSAKVPLVSANMLSSHHTKTVNTLTDNNPTFDATISGEFDEEKLNTVIRLCEHWWTDQEQQHILEASVSDGEMFGSVIEKVGFNVENEYPFGEVEAETVSLFNFGWYPVKAKHVQKCDATLHFYPISIREAKRRWPKHASDIIADDEYIKAINDQRTEITGAKQDEQSYLTKISNVVKNLVSSRNATEAEESEETVVVECWVKDYSGGYFGNIRRIQCGCCGNVVFSDENNPNINPDLPEEDAMTTYLWDKFPFSVTPSVTDSSSMLGIPDYEQLEALNIEVNKTISQLTMVKDKASRLKLVNPMTSGVPNEHLTNYPGIINPSNVNHGIEYLKPPQLDPNILKALEIYKDFFFSIAGTFDLDSTQGPGRDVIAYKAIAALLENASRMLRGKTRNYSKMIRERGRMYLALAQNWYTESRWVPFSDSTGKKDVMQVQGKDLILPIKLTVVSGSTMPKSQVQKREEALELYKQQAIDQEELLKSLDWSDWKSVVKRMQAGPMGMLFEKLMGVGVPEELIQYFKEIAELEDKDLEKAIEGGEIPPFMQVLQSLMAGGEQQAEPPDPTLEAEANMKQAQAAKYQAETELTREKIVTERVEQLVRTKGVDFDEEKLKILRAQVVAELASKEYEMENSDLGNEVPSAESKVQGPYREKGLKSNNLEWE